MAKRNDILIENSYIPKNTDISRQRIEAVAKKYRIEERAIEAGQKNEPRTEDTHADECQRGLVDESQSFVAAVTRRAGQETSERINQARALMPTGMDTGLEQANIRRAAAEAKDRYKDDLDLTWTDRLRKLRDLLVFEQKNKMPPQSAIYGNDRPMFYAVLLAIILAEAALNAFLFEELQDRGLFGGLMLALTVGIANVLMGAGTGFLGWRLMGHVRWSHRALGTVITLVLMMGALALHLALGDLREAITRNTGAQIDFLVILQPWRWFAYTSIPPFVLFAVGVAAFGIAAMKARGGSLGIVAPYWQHEVWDRRFRAADAAFEDAKANFKNGIQNAFDGECAKLRARHAANITQVGDIRRLMAEAQGIERTLGDSIQDELGRLHIWLRMYREHNRAVRTTPAPAYFESFPAFEEWRATRLDLSELRQLAAQAEEVLGANAAKLAALEEQTLKEQTAATEAWLTVASASERRAAQQLVRDDTQPDAKPT